MSKLPLGRKKAKPPVPKRRPRAPPRRRRFRLVRRYGKREMQLIWTSSIAVAMGIILSTFLIYATFGLDITTGGEISLAGAKLTLPSWDNFVIVSMALAMTPPATAQFLDRRWKLAIERNLPHLLRDLTDAQRSGLTFVRALEMASQRDYGPLTDEIRKVVVRISWGMSYEDALLAMGDYVGTPLVRRTMVLIVEAVKSGAKLEEVFSMVTDHLRSLQLLQRERAASMRPYAFTIYGGYMVFLLAAVLIYKTFFSVLTGFQATAAAGAPLGFTMMASPEEYRTLFYHMSVVEAIIGGLIAGKLGEGAVGGGLKHAVILMAVAIVVFNTFV